MRQAKNFKLLNTKEIKTLVLFCIFALCMVAAWLTFSPNGMLAYRSVKNQMESVQAENSRLREENRLLQETLDKIKNDPSYLEEVARSEHNFLKKNETVFEFK
ncbi:MAG: septum formation initiator family protein [Pseudomonadota bacterium]